MLTPAPRHGRGWRKPVIAMAMGTLMSVAMAQGQVCAQSLGEKFTFRVKEKTLGPALEEIYQLTGVPLLYPHALATTEGVNPVIGSYTVEQALDILLGGTRFSGGLANGGVIVISLNNKDREEAPMTSGTLKKSLLASVGVLMFGAAYAQDVERVEEDKKQEVDNITVTGTNIRGVAPDSSPVQTYTREDIDISGAATAQDFIQTLPTNFGGGSNNGRLGLPNDDSTSFNASSNGGSFGSSANLRGLGSGATLVLLNGRRLAPASGIGEFTDISMIPASALERVEVLTDGASSIYGGDAVAGVVNFITRDDFDGVETSFQYGTVTQGDLNQYRAGITGGKSWDAGNALVAYEYFDQDNLSAGDRDFSRDAVLPNDLLPHQRRHSVLASISQNVAPEIQVFSDIAYLARDVQQDRTQAGGNIVNFFSSSESLSISGGGLWNIADNWVFDVSAGYSDWNNDTSRITRTATSSPSTLQDRSVSSEIWTVDAKTSGALFELPGGDFKVAMGGHYRSEGFSNFRVETDVLERDGNRDVYALFAEAYIPIIGSENAVQGVERFEINVSGRFDDYSDFGSTLNPKVGALWSPFDGLNLRGSYSTSFNPPPLGRVGASDFVAVSALRSRWNGIFGLTPADPSIADVTEITAFGTSAELDAETSRAFTAGVDFNRQTENLGVTITTTYFDIDFKNRLGSTPCPTCNVSAVFDAPNVAFANPDLLPDGTVTFDPSQDEISTLLNNLDFLNVLDNTDPLDTEILNFVAVVRNLAGTQVRGIDFDIGYELESEFGKLLLGLDGTYLIDFQQQAASTTPSVEQLNTLFNPVDLKLRGRAGYSSGGFTANLFLNYVDSYQIDNTDDAATVDSWTTVDMSLSYNTREHAKSALLKSLMLRLSVRNLFDKAPPATPSNPAFGIYGFDPTNSSPLGRFVAFELTKRF